MRSLVVVLLLGLAIRAGAEDAASLVQESMARYRDADGAADGWREIYDEGIRLAERAIELDARNADAHYALFLNLGRRAERSGVGAQLFTVRRLRKLLDQTIALDPRHAHAWEARGEMLRSLPRLLGGSTAEARTSLRRATEIDPGWAKPWLRLAELEGDDDPAAARKLAEEARRLACDSARKDADICEAANAFVARLAR